MIFVKLFLTLALTLALLNSSQAASISLSTSPSVSISTSISTSTSYSFSTQISVVLAPPGQVQNSCPGQRTLLCLYYTEPSGYFYPSFNLYYRVAGNPNTPYTVIRGIQALSVMLNETEILAATNYEVTVTGVTYGGVESPMAPTNTFMTSTPDPRDSSQAGVSNIVITAGVKSLSYSFTLGTSTPQQLNFRAHCVKPSGKTYDRKVNVFRPNTTDTFTRFITGSVCKAKIHIKYFDENTNDNAEARFGPKMKWVTGLRIM